MNLRIRLHLCIILLHLFIGATWAQNAKLSNWQLEASFSIVDENQNGLLSLTELGKFNAEFGWFLKPENYNHANLNLDKGLDKEEIDGYLAMAQSYRTEQENWSLKSLNKKYPYFKKAKAKYFKRQPELAIALLSNLTWARQNSEIIDRLVADRKWLHDNPKAIQALHTNLSWLVENPQIAYKFYQQKETQTYLPHFDLWRTEHSTLIKKTKKNKEQLANKQAYASRSKSNNAELLKLKQQVKLLNAKLLDQNTRSQQQKAAIDSLEKANQNYAQKVKLLNKEVYVIKDSLKKDLDNITMKDPKDLTSVKELKKQIRYMKIEKQLARIEEDSLLAENIRYKKKVNHLEKQLTLTPTVKPTPKADQSEKMKQLQSQLNKALAKLEAKQNAKKASMDSMLVAYEKLNQKYVALTNEYESVLDDKENLLLSFDNNSNTATEESIQELDLASSNKQIELQNDLYEFKQKAQKYKKGYDSLLIAQENKDWEISDLKQKKVLLQTQLESYEMEKSQTVDLSPKEASEKELLQENIKLESEIARMVRKQKEEKKRKAAEKDSLLVQMDQLHQDLLETKNTLNLLESLNDTDTSTFNLFQKAVDGYNKQITRYEVKIEELQYDNQKLRGQLESQIVDATETEKNLTSELEESRKVAMRLNSRNEKLRKRKGNRPLSAKVNDMIEELEAAQQKIIHLSKENNAMRDQLETNFAYLSQQLKQQKKLERQVNNYTQRLTRLNHQKDSLTQQVNKQQVYADWTDSMQYYRRVITDIEKRMQKQQYYHDYERVSYEQEVDSLVEEIALLQKQNKRLANSRQVNVEQINSIEARRLKLENDENKFRERKQLIIRKEAVIQRKLQEIAVKEKKYQNMLEMEKQLKLREQRLKAKGGG